MSFTIENKLCDDVLGVILSFKGMKTKHHEQFDKCLNKLSSLKLSWDRGEKAMGYSFGAFKIISTYWTFKNSGIKI